METGTVWVPLVALAASCLVGCTAAAPAAAPTQQSKVDRNHQVERDQRILERRRLVLQNKVLAELRKLREGRQASTDGVAPARDEPPASNADEELIVFGGASRDVFLGCLCDEQHADSVFNMLGQHGADDSPLSMRNKFAPYGSDKDDTSACNPAATHPPVVLASDGKSLGLLTMNSFLPRRIAAPSVTDWLTRMCGE